MRVERSQRIERLTYSADETLAFATALGERLDAGATICLSGALGSGKSVVARGLCRGLGVAEGVLSPTFILFEEYSGRMPVVHCDLYRLEHEEQVADLGVFDRIGDGSVVIVEWGERSPQLLAAADIVIALVVTGVNGENDRAITVHMTPALAEHLTGI